MKGLSKRNLEYMAVFAGNYPDLLVIENDKKIVQQPAAQLKSEGKTIMQQAAAQFQQDYFINSQQGVILNIPHLTHVKRQIIITIKRKYKPMAKKKVDYNKKNRDKPTNTSEYHKSTVNNNYYGMN